MKQRILLSLDKLLSGHPDLHAFLNHTEEQPTKLFQGKGVATEKVQFQDSDR